LVAFKNAINSWVDPHTIDLNLYGVLDSSIKMPDIEAQRGNFFLQFLRETLLSAPIGAE
jgi:hypothetical protein